MKVIYAYYGVSCAKGNLRKSVQWFSTIWAGLQCNGKSSCSGRVTNHNLKNDPYRGCPKDFIVVAKCSNGNIIADSVKAVGGEGQTFTLNCHSVW